MLAVGDWLNPVPVPKAVLPVVELYQVMTPVAQVAFSVMAVPEQIFVALTDTLVGIAGIVVTLTWLVATLLLWQGDVTQAA